MQVESIAAYVAAIGGHLRLVADFDQATTTFVDYTGACKPTVSTAHAVLFGSTLDFWRRPDLAHA